MLDEMGLSPQVQPHIGWPYGECVRASYASLLDLPMAAVPRFDPGTRKEPDQTIAERKWLRSIGYDLIIVDAGPGVPAPLIPSDLDHLLFVTTSRGPHGHRVVGRGGKVIWDPYPGGSEVTSIVSYYFVVPRVVRARPPRRVPLSNIGLLRHVQPHIGHPFGECVRTSYASMLDLPLSSVPRFDPGTRTERDQTVAERRWLRSRGLDLVIVRASSNSKTPLVPRDFDHMLSLRTKCGNGHRTVGRGGRLLWDPHPGGARVTGLKAYYFVVPAGKPTT